MKATTPIDVLALDLEGVLVSNAMSALPRPGLRRFLDFCLARFQRVALFTAVHPTRARQVITSLATMGDTPSSFKDIEIVKWQGAYKDLTYLNILDINRARLIDDQESYVHPDQKRLWIPIEEWNYRHRPEQDWELERVMDLLASMLPTDGDGSAP